MTDEFDLQEAFEGLKPEEAQALTARIRDRLKGEVEAFRSEKQRTPLDEAEEQEIAGLTSRGTLNATQRDIVRRKYSAIRNAPAPEEDPEIEEIKDDPRALLRLYQSRVSKIARNDPLKLRKRTEIAARFRALGLNI